MIVGIAGGSGALGRALLAALIERGDRVVVLSRRPESVKDLPRGASAASYEAPLDEFDALINLAGAGIADKRWTSEYKKVIRSSRVDLTASLVNQMRELRDPPKVLVNASATGIYGDRGDEEISEQSEIGAGFLESLCQDWEREAAKAEALGTRVVRLRIGIVLDRESGALARMLPPFRWFVGGKLASGKQWMSWIHIQDLVSLILTSLDNEAYEGPINATSPHPLRNVDFSKSLARVLGRPCWAPVPALVLKLMLGEFAQFLIGGQRVLPTRALELGFQFKHPELEEALHQLLD